MLVDVSDCRLATTLLGTEFATPVGIAPVAYHKLADPEGEVATARAAAAAGALYVVSVFASRTLEEIASAGATLWLQMYWFRKREVMLALAERAAAAGYQALVLTLDTPRVGRRLRDLRRGFAVPPGITAANVDPAVMAGTHLRRSGTSAIEQHSRDQFDPSVTWNDLDWLRGQTGMPLVVKGILTAEDARRAVKHGVAAIVVSNHGGRQLDGAVATMDALPEVVDAVAGACPVLVDGGVRSGVDVLKALASGASAVLVGRPVLWGLAYGGAEGAQAVLDLLTTELADAMVLSGRPRLADLDRTLLTPA